MNKSKERSFKKIATNKVARVTLNKDKRVGADDLGLASRRLAVEVLIKVESEHAYVNLALANAFKRTQLSERDRAFVTALVQGIVRYRSGIDERLTSLLRQPLAKMPFPLRNILRLGVFQIEHMANIPHPAVLNTCNKLARILGHPGHVKLVNGLLRNYIRCRPNSQPSVLNINDARQLAVCHSMPIWLVQRWQEIWGPAEANLLLQCTQQVPLLTLRTCELNISTQGLMSILEARGIHCRQGLLVDTCLIVEDRGKLKGPVQKFPGYEDGLFTVQDEAAAFISKVVDPQPGETVVDLCAAPGGKSLHLAELMLNKGRVIAVDSHPGRLNLLRKNRQRIALTNIETVVADSRTYVFDGVCDRVLIDAPCTGTGVIHRRSDIRFKREPQDISKLVELQRELLTHASTLVRTGGILVYSTCSIEPEENVQNFNWFLQQHKNFQADSLKPFVSPKLLEKWFTGTEEEISNPNLNWLQLLPSRHEMSGFFVARFKRCD